MEVNWIRPEENEPQGEVLAVNNKRFFLIGYVHWSEDEYCWACQSESEILYNVTSYIPVSELEKTVKS